MLVVAAASLEALVQCCLLPDITVYRLDSKTQEVKTVEVSKGQIISKLTDLYLYLIFEISIWKSITDSKKINNKFIDFFFEFRT